MTQKEKYAIIDGAGIKSSIMWDEDTTAWSYASNAPQKGQGCDYWKLLPTLYRAVDKRAKAISSMPFTLYSGKDASSETEFEVSDDWQNKIGLIPDMTRLLYIIEAGLMLFGRMYLMRFKNVVGYNKLIRNVAPGTIRLDEKALENGELIFLHKVKVIEKTLTVDDVIYFWLPDPNVEVGPPISWPALTALNACGVLTSLDIFVKAFFDHGAMKAVIFSTEGMPPGEAEKVKAWYQRFGAGLKNAWNTLVVNAQKMLPVIVGEGIKELENVTLTQDKQREIAIAFDIPYTLFVGEDSNLATAIQHKHNWYQDCIIPEAKFIEGVLNDQVFRPLGLHLEFDPETLEFMQEDEAARASSLGALVNAGLPLLMAMDILGYDLTDEQRAELEAEKEKADEQAQALRDNLANAPKQAPGDTQKPIQDGQIEKPQQNAVEGNLTPSKAYQGDLDRWQRFAIRQVKEGHLPTKTFICDTIPQECRSFIEACLSSAKDIQDVKLAFASIVPGENKEAISQLLHNPEKEDLISVSDTTASDTQIASLLEGIKLGVEALKAV